MVKLIDNFTDAEGNIVKQTQRKKKILTVANPDLRGTGKGAKIRGEPVLLPGPSPRSATVKFCGCKINTTIKGESYLIGKS